MSYPLDLDEYSEARLIAELTHRATLRAEGVCDYCGRNSNLPACRFPERHNLATRQSVENYRPFSGDVEFQQEFFRRKPDDRWVVAVGSRPEDPSHTFQIVSWSTNGLNGEESDGHWIWSEALIFLRWITGEPVGVFNPSNQNAAKTEVKAEIADA